MKKFRAVPTGAEAPNSAYFDAKEQETTKDTNGVKKLLDGLIRGDCEGIDNATALTISKYAEEVGLI